MGLEVIEGIRYCNRSYDRQMNEAITRYRLKGIDLCDVSVSGTTIYKDWMDKQSARVQSIEDNYMDITPEKAAAIAQDFQSEIERVQAERVIRMVNKNG